MSESQGFEEAAEESEETTEEELEEAPSDDLATEESEETTEEELEEAPSDDLATEESEEANVDISGVEESPQAWSEGGHALDALDDGDEIKKVQFPQLDTTVVPRVKEKSERLNNVIVDISVELGTKEITVREFTDLKEQDVIELDKLAGEAFDIRVNGRRFAEGEVVVVTNLMAVRITRLYDFPADEAAEK